MAKDDERDGFLNCDEYREAIKRDNAMARVATARGNFYEMIANEASYFLRTLLSGTSVVSKEVRRAVLGRRPDINPRELRVMGPVMIRLARMGLIRKIGFTTRGRSHGGSGTEWEVT